MTRMIEEQRQQIGTLKALGYSDGVIAFKYFAYAMLSTVSGALAGVVVGEKNPALGYYECLRHAVYRTPVLHDPAELGRREALRFWRVQPAPAWRRSRHATKNSPQVRQS